MKRLLLALLFATGCMAQTVPGNSSLSGNSVWVPGPIAVNIPQFVQVAPLGSNSGVSNIVFTFSSNVSTGNTIAIWACWVDPTATFTNFTKSAGTATVGAFTTVGSNGSGASVTSGNDHCNDGWVQVTGGGTLTISANISSVAAGTVSSSGSEYSLVLSSTPLDNQAMQAQTSESGTNAATSGAATTSSSGDLIFGFNFDFGGNATLISAGTGFTARFSGLSNFQQEDLVQSAAGSIAATFTYTGGTSDTIISGMMALKHS